MLCLALFGRYRCSFGKTEDPFCKTDIWYKLLNMNMFGIRFSNRCLFWPNRGLIGPTNLDKTGF